MRRGLRRVAEQGSAAAALPILRNRLISIRRRRNTEIYVPGTVCGKQDGGLVFDLAEFFSAAYALQAQRLAAFSQWLTATYKSAIKSPSIEPRPEAPCPPERPARGAGEYRGYRGISNYPGAVDRCRYPVCTVWGRLKRAADFVCLRVIHSGSMGEGRKRSDRNMFAESIAK